MTDHSSISVFKAVKRKWTVSTLTADILFASAAGILLIYPLNYTTDISFWWLLPVIASIAALIIYLDKSWRISDTDIASYLDRKFPELEESSRLLLQPAETLTMLQQLQVNKIAQNVQHVDRPGKINSKIFPALGVVLIAGLIAVIISNFSSNEKPVSTIINSESANTKPVKELVQIAEVNTTVIPPAYTRKLPLKQDFSNIIAVEGSTAKWAIKTTSAAENVSLILNDTKSYRFSLSNNDSTVWEFNLMLSRSGFYQFVVDGKTSELYQLQITRDLPPKIVVADPKPDLLIKYGEPKHFVLQTIASDDYGIQNAYAFATVSSGSGEAVKFKQKQLNFAANFSTRNTTYDLRQTIRLDSLGMQPGDELYIYVMAIDNLNQETRSDMYRVILEDTAQLFSVDGLMNGLDIKPEYFRSQRQIIIETEQLLRDQAKLTKEEFENKSNSLGIDQKLLRLRYGKFLGEEAVTYGQGEAEQHEEGEEHDDHQNESSSPKDVLSQFGHSHDNAEDATFFDPATKKQLRATLNEMWKAELQLRTFKPKDALPFELETLRLLKDLQQQSRVYVAKTSSKTTPLKPETRLTGEMEEIVSPVFSYTNIYTPSQSEPLQQALTALQQLQLNGAYNPATLVILNEANKLLAGKAADEPSKYIKALSAIRNIINSINVNKVILSVDIITAQKALQVMIDIPVPRPVLKQQESGTLSDFYFQQLEKGKN